MVLDAWWEFLPDDILHLSPEEWKLWMDRIASSVHDSTSSTGRTQPMIWDWASQHPESIERDELTRWSIMGWDTDKLMY